MPRPRRGFSLMEVLLAVFILGIGLIMVATIFPVGADWTRQSTEDSIAQTIAHNALSVIENHYRSGFPGVGTTVSGIPGFPNTVPVSERCYQFGSTTPFPAPKPASCLYYWTALARRQPNQVGTSPSMTYDLYILVFRKGSADQTFTQLPSGEVPYVRDSLGSTPLPGMSANLEPTLVSASYNAGSYDSANAGSATPITGEAPPVGFIGIGATSGTVFRQSASIDAVNPSNDKAVPRPALAGNEQVIYAAPADNTTASPLIYVYQTTISF